MAGWIVVGGLAVLALAAVLPVRAQFRHGRHERPPPRTDPGELEDAWARGSMDLRADLAVHHELPPWWVDPVPWEHLASDERIEEGELDLPEGWHADPWVPRSVRMIEIRRRLPEQEEPSPEEVAASRAAHGYIPELDPGPGPVGDASEQATMDLPQLQDPGQHHPQPARQCATVPRLPQVHGRPDSAVGLGPRAGAVLAAYEQRLGARREACT